MNLSTDTKQFIDKLPTTRHYQLKTDKLWADFQKIQNPISYSCVYYYWSDESGKWIKYSTIHSNSLEDVRNDILNEIKAVA